MRPLPRRHGGPPHGGPRGGGRLPPATRSLFEDQAAAGKEARLSETLDTITRAFGPGAVLFGAQGDGTIRNAREHQSPHYTTLWSDIPGVKVE